MFSNSVRIKRLTISLALIITPCAYAIDLTKSIDKNDAEWNELTKADRQASYYPSAVVKTDQDGVVFTFDGSIGKANYKTGDLLGGWPITRWEYEYVESRVTQTYYNDFYSSIYGAEQYVADSEKLVHLMGCVQSAPLRYGDVDGDDDSELVLFLADQVSTDMLVFSPAKEKVVFSSKLNFTDAIHTSDVPEHYPHESDYQYLSWRDVWAGEPPTPATRAYGKLYFDDFDEDGKRDILVWRKLYETHLKNEEAQGFKMIGETLLHYSLTDGEYLPQETEEPEIRSWLAADELTWQKGYPSKSECPGEEGQLIPEMHDPLLNDPDVLR